MRLIELVDSDSKEQLAGGCILPDGQVALAWYGKHKTHGVFPDFESFQTIQSKIPNRLIRDYEPDNTELSLNIHIYSFHLLREKDVTGVSGTGIVAVGCDFFQAGCVLQWTGKVKSTFWYPSIAIVKEIHIHNEKTRIVINKQNEHSFDPN